MGMHQAPQQESVGISKTALDEMCAKRCRVRFHRPVQIDEKSMPTMTSASSEMSGYETSSGQMIDQCDVTAAPTV